VRSSAFDRSGSQMTKVFNVAITLAVGSALGGCLVYDWV
jgi:hypothetical protein